VRVLLNELTRINSHLSGWEACNGYRRSPFSYIAFASAKSVELVRDGQRTAHDDLVLPRGGIALEPPLGFFDRVRNFAGYFPSKIDEYENLLTGNPIWTMRTKGVARMTAEDAIALGASGPTLRGSGVDFDLRRDIPYSSYEKFQFKVPVSQEGDVFARYIAAYRNCASRP